MANKELAERRFEVITHEQRLAEDPRGLTRVTIIGDYIFRELRIPKPVDEKSIETEEN